MMLKINPFKKKETSDIEKQIRKFPRRKRENLRKLWNDWENQNVVKIEEYKK